MKNVLILVFLVSMANAATTIGDGSFGTVYEVFKAWIGGSLGYIIALLGTIGSIVWFMLGDGLFGSGGQYGKMFAGIFISFFVGGCVGLVQAMADLGRVTFG